MEMRKVREMEMERVSVIVRVREMVRKIVMMVKLIRVRVNELK